MKLKSFVLGFCVAVVAPSFVLSSDGSMELCKAILSPEDCFKLGLTVERCASDLREAIGEAIRRRPIFSRDPKVFMTNGEVRGLPLYGQCKIYVEYVGDAYQNTYVVLEGSDLCTRFSLFYRVATTTLDSRGAIHLKEPNQMDLHRQVIVRYRVFPPEVFEHAFNSLS